MLNHYLFDSKFSLNNKKVIHIVLGNESSNLDSIVSSIVYAYFMEKNSSNADHLYVPVLNIPSTDFYLKTEAVHLFREAGIDTANVIFIDEINITEIYKAGRLKIILVDHNLLPDRLKYLAECIEEIIDHHEDDKFYTSAVKTIVPAGSCATLVAEKIITKTGRITDNKAAELLAGTILLDTVNLSNPDGRTTDKDIEIIKYLTERFHIDRNRFYDQLQYEKYNTAPLSSYDILRKDYRHYLMEDGRKTGFSSVFVQMEKWYKKDPNLLESVEIFYKEKSLDLLFILISSADPDLTGELVLFSENAVLLEGMFAYLRNNGMELNPVHGKVPFDRRAGIYLLGGNAGWSRKILVPLVKEYFTD